MALKDVHIVLQADLLERLGNLAKALDVSRNMLVRRAIEEFLVNKERDRLDRDLDEYVRQMAPYTDGMILASTEW